MLTGLAGAGAIGICGTTISTARAAESAGLHQQAKLAAHDVDPADRFGDSVAVSDNGTTVLVGVSEDEDPNGERAGSAYVFERSNETWRPQAKLTAEDGDTRDYFGDAVAVSSDGTTALVGAATDEDPNGERAGSAYVFERSNGEWHQRAKFIPDDGDGDDYFGVSVAVSGDGTTALVGAQSDEDPNGDYAGSAYVFRRANDEWSQQTKLTAEDGEPFAFFGISVAISSDGTTVLVGGPNGRNSNDDNGGATYVFDRSDEKWNQRAKLTAGDGNLGDSFGDAVAVSGDGTTAIVGGRGDENPSGTESGSVYAFERSSDEWSQRTKFTAEDGDSPDFFGNAVAVSSDGTTALVGAIGDDDPNGENAGSVYAFRRSNDEWSQQTKLTAEDGDANDSFGDAVAVSSDGTTALVGAIGDENPNGEEAGSAYVFESGLSSPGTPAVTGETPATDPNDDGRYEDVNGDGAFDIADVSALFRNYRSEAVQNRPERFDFNGDETSDIVDVIALLARLL
ncbi:FG-GAP repeat-containing protein, possibly sugar-related [Halorhabdus tiamatea SARL4B]|uniref:FG-GAP repeat-containing protein, possibly sugar-related n=1 Tax=Halorhabdus tiamatea SARL4B TaxID=1033806 RepID=F7PM90_9EURY|nr:FG-GAP repeat-containing protein, possibly sugar-related [Halorhabdus tiamatea SARL4B]